MLARCFQAIRIHVNDELNALDETLASVHTVLRTGGRCCVLSYHSLEDRRVKNAFRGSGGGGDCGGGGGAWTPVLKRALTPSLAEIEANSRSRSAKLRVAEKRVESRGR